MVPSGGHRVFRGYAANRSTDVRTGLELGDGRRLSGARSRCADDRSGSRGLGPTTRDEWLDQLLSRSDHTALEPEVLDRLLEGIGAAIDDHGGSFVMNFETVLITATRLG